MTTSATTPAMVSTTAASASTFYSSIGVNTHIDFSWTAYNNLSSVESALSYLGVANVRDSIDNPADPAKFAQLNADLGVKFDVYIAPGSVSYAWQLQQIEANIGIISSVEGPNESDSESYSYNGLTGTAAAKAEQSALYSAIKGDASASQVKVIESSFGQTGTFSTIGAIGNADYGNAHIYFGTDNNPGWNGWIPTMEGLAQNVAPGKPVAVTETGYSTVTGSSNGVDDLVQAKYTLDDILDEFKSGAKVIDLYELVDEQASPGNVEDNFGLFNNNWTAKPAATAVHNLMAILKDTGSLANPGSLTYSLTGMPTAGNSELFEKSDGTFVLALWNDTRLASATTGADIAVAPVMVTLTLAQTFSTIDVYDPLSGSAPVQVASNAQTLQISLPDHPVLIEFGSPVVIPPVLTAPVVIPPVVTTPIVTTPIVTAAPALTGPQLTVPSTEAVAASATVAVSGVTLLDSFAAGHAGNMALSVWDSSGKLTMKNATGVAISGSGSSSITYNGTYANIVAALASLTYTAAGAGGNDTIHISLYDQAGLSTQKTVSVSVGAPTSSGSITPITTPSPVSAAPTPPAATGSIVAGPVLGLPGAETMAASSTSAIAGITLADAFAAGNAGNMALSVWDSSGTLAMKNAAGVAVAGSGSGSITYDATYANIVAALASLAYTAGAAGGSDAIHFSLYDQAGRSTSGTIAVGAGGPASSTAAAAGSLPPAVTAPVLSGPQLTAPGSEILPAGTATAVSGITLNDSFAAGNAGAMAFSVWDSNGTLTMQNAAGATVAGSGGTSITYNATYANVVAALASLSYTSGAAGGSDAIHISIYDQAGISTNDTIGVAATSAPGGVLSGTAGNDTIYTTANSTVNGNGGNDTYLFGTGDGSVTLHNGAATTTAAQGQVNLLGAVTDQNLWLVQSGNDLQVDILGTSDKLTISGWYGGSGSQVQAFEAGGLKLDSSINTLVQAMATYSANNGAFNPQTAGAGMPNDAALQATIAAAWHH